MVMVRPFRKPTSSTLAIQEAHVLHVGDDEDALQIAHVLHVGDDEDDL
jgi:hypothetical protein